MVCQKKSRDAKHGLIFKEYRGPIRWIQFCREKMVLNPGQNWYIFRFQLHLWFSHDIKDRLEMVGSSLLNTPPQVEYGIIFSIESFLQKFKLATD